MSNLDGWTEKYGYEDGVVCEMLLSQLLSEIARQMHEDMKREIFNKSPQQLRTEARLLTKLIATSHPALFDLLRTSGVLCVNKPTNNTPVKTLYNDTDYNPAKILDNVTDKASDTNASTLQASTPTHVDGMGAAKGGETHKDSSKDGEAGSSKGKRKGRKKR